MTTPEKLLLLLDLGVFTSSELNTLCMTMAMYHNSVRMAPPDVKQVLGQLAAAAYKFDLTNYPGDAALWMIELTGSKKNFRDDPATQARVEKFFFDLHRLLGPPEVIDCHPKQLAALFKQALAGLPERH